MTAAVWDFLVGDDWCTALGVLLAIAGTALLASANIAAWWVLPCAIPLILWASVRRALAEAGDR
jgi:hypothetical protein